MPAPKQPQAASEPHTPPRHLLAPAVPRRMLLIALAVGVAVALACHLLLPYAPHRSETGGEFVGAPGLATDVETALDPTQVQGLAVARFDNHAPDEVEWVTAGTADGTVPVSTDTPFETASVFKVFTAMLLADMVERGETSLDRTLGEIFPDTAFADPEIATVTLQELATHHSGIPTEAEVGVLGALSSLVRGDKYRDATAPLEFAATTVSWNRGRYQYSNAGYALLGEALAKEVGSAFPDLVHERLFSPLGLDGTAILPEGTPEGGAGPHIEAGARVQDWHNSDYAAAGITTWSTPEDLVSLMAAIARGDAPGMGALETVHEEIDPVVPAAGNESTPLGMGLGWHLTDVSDADEVVWHSGGTLGSRTMIATDGNRSVVVMANSFGVEAPALAFTLLRDASQPVPTASSSPLVLAQTLLITLLPPILLCGLMLRRRTLLTQRPLDRLRIVSLTLGAFAWVAAALRLGGWVDTPEVVWALGAGVAAAGVVLGVWHWRAAPIEAGRWRWLHVPVFALSVALSSVVLAGTLWGTLTVW